MTLKLTVSGMKIVPGGPAKGATFYVGLDTDRNGKSNYFLDVYTDETGVSWDVEGPTEKLLKQTPTMSFFSSGNTFTFKLGSTDIGGATGFDYYVSSAMQDAASGKRLDGDDAPDGGAGRTPSRASSPSSALRARRGPIPSPESRSSSRSR